MVDYLIKGETLNTIANGVRNVSGVNKELTPSSMAEIMSSLSVTGVDTFDATAVSNEIFANKTAYVDGEKVTGTFSIDNELNTLDTLINDISKALEGKAAGGESNLQSKTVTPTTSQQTVKPDSGYDGLSQVTVNAMTTATQATPSISVSSGGLITASSTQSAGYVSAGTKSATKQLTVQAAQTITPSTSNKTIASGRYLTGTQTIKGDANLKAENIAEGVTIFGVTGTHSGGGASVETCTMNLSSTDGYIGNICATVFDGTNIVPYVHFDHVGVKTFSLENVVCSSAIEVFISGISFVGVTTDGGASLYSNTYYPHMKVIMAPNEAGAMGTATFYDND